VNGSLVGDDPAKARTLEAGPMAHGKGLMILSWSLRGIAAVILLQTLFFKFAAAKESVYIFNTLGLAQKARISDC
jgi:hypothetical protein